MKKSYALPGFALLYLVIILATSLTALVLAAGIYGAFSGARLRTENQGAVARVLADDCGERLLMQLRNAPSVLGSGTITTSTGTCTYTMSGASPTITIQITATSGTLYKRLTITTAQFEPTIIASWVEGT